MPHQQPRPEGALTRLRDLEKSPTTVEEALAFFDALPAVTVDAILGRWAGSGLRTGNPLDGLLEEYGWHGKRFDSADDAHPLVFRDGEELFSVNPALVPMRAVTRLNKALRTRMLSAAGHAVMKLARTTSPAARLRMMEHRGVTTATMSYDALPINDHFRQVDDDTLLGLMDLRGSDEPFFFVLRREAPSPQA